ncbi:MAG: FAD-binding oxidoreductase [Acidovorax sp.]|uniref:FAD-binding oxidoreductase n=1 Tax=Acidovorax sp. TaxID=1872122 RepID=UPI00391C7F51
MSSSDSAWPRIARRPVPGSLIDELRMIFGARLSTALSVREQHGRDESPFEVAGPDAVVFCEETEDVVAALGLAAKHLVPVIPFGAGTSLEGHLLAVQGGISLDLSRMSRILRIDADDLTATVQPGVTREQLNAEIRHTGLFFPVDPGANASLGGMCATRASGTNAVRYGTMRENVLALEVVTAAAEVIRTGTRARKSSAGYDLTRLFIGSEGTLGVITEVTVRLYPVPEASSVAVCNFRSVSQAVAVTIATVQIGIPIARVELLDAHAVRAVNKYAHLQLLETPMLFIEFQGSEQEVAAQARTVQQIASDNGGEDFQWAVTQEERTRLWTARHHAYFAGMAAYPGCRTVTTDACVPISRLSEAIADSVSDADSSGLPYYIVGHVGDGNYHVSYLVDPGIPKQRALAEAMSRRVVECAMLLEGTCTGEHGIGLHKQDFLAMEAGPGGLQMMRTIKRALDPDNILNPGKIFSL